MSFSAGVFSINTAGQPVVTGTVISSTAFNSLTSDLATGLSTCVLKDGTQTLTANIPMSSFKLTGLAAGSAAGDSLRYEQGLQSIMTTTGDIVVASAANTAARYAATATVAAHATTMDPWVARTVTLSGSAVTFTDIADADYIGQQVLLIMNAAHIWTDGAVFDVQGGATYTTAAGDQVLLVATALDAFDVTIFPANGGIVSSKGRVAITLGTEQPSTSGSSVNFTSIPAGVRKIIVNGVGVSTNGTANWVLQLGDTDGLEATGYLSSAFNVTATTDATTGFLINKASVAAVVYRFQAILSLEDSTDFTWTCSSQTGGAGEPAQFQIGSKSLSAELDRLSIVTTDTWDAGVINISFE